MIPLFLIHLKKNDTIRAVTFLKKKGKQWFHFLFHCFKSLSLWQKKELARLNPRHLPYWLYEVWIIILAPNFKWVYFILKTTVVICFHDSREAESWPDLEAGWDEGSNAEVGSNILNSVQWGYKVKDWRVCYKLILQSLYLCNPYFKL